MKITRGAAACSLGAVLLLAACSQGGRATEDVAHDSARVSASAVFVDGTILATGASVALRVTGPSYAANLPTGRGMLPPIAADGAYTIADAAGHVFGTFTTEAGAVVSTSGAITVGAQGLGFDATRLASVPLPTGTLTSPSNLGVYQLAGVSSTFSASPTFRLADGTYSVTDPTGAHVLGSFTVASRVVTAATGAIVRVPGGVSFDTTKLARVAFSATGLSTPPAVQLRFGADTTAVGSLVAFLADGTYTVANTTLDRVYGSFDVVGHLVVAGHGAVVPSPTGISFDTTKLAKVTFATSTLTAFPAMQIVRLPIVGNALTGGPAPTQTPAVSVPAGSYTLTDGSGTKTYGTFTVTGTSVTGVTGALTIAGSGIGFDLTRLARVVLPMPGVPNNLPLQIPDTTQYAQVPTPVGPVTLHLPDGAYQATSVLGRDFGRFVVSGHVVTSAEGGLAVNATNGIAFSSCDMATVNILGGNSGSTIAIPDISLATPLSLPQVYRLPIGHYPVVVNGQTPTPWFIDVPATGPIASSFPFTTCVPPHTPPSCVVVGASNATCRTPPAVHCVGTPTAPATIAGVCNASVDNVSALAGSCSDAGGGLASCTFDGVSSETLGTGTHAVSVVGTADDGSVATCTSFVRVTCTESPLVSCVGSSSAPVPFTTAAGSCSFSIAGWGGTCDDAGDGVASCTFDGQANESLAPGSYAVAVAGTSVDGASASCTSYVTISDGEAPTVTCAPPVTLECAGPTTPISTTASCTDNCGACTTSCDSRALPVGAQTLGCTATDAGGLSSRCDASITIVDSTPPALSVTASPSALWVPDHTLVPIALAISASDVCDPSPAISCSAESSEAPLTLGSGHTAPDIVWTDGQLYLRAERSGAGSGRTYTIVCTALDASGNASSATTTVFVPHNQ